MVKHIVLWTFKENVDKDAAFVGLEQTFAAFVGEVPGLHSFRLSRGFAGWDVCLESEHDDKAALDAYYNFPAHLEAKKVVAATRAQRASCDFEL